MHVWAVIFQASGVEEYRELYQRALALLDEQSRASVERYYHFVDRFRGLVGRLLIRQLLSDRGVRLQDMSFGTTAARKPYITTSSLSEPVGYNITHDNGVVAMTYSIGSELYPEPPAYRVGIDVMLLQLPKRLTFTEFVETVSDQLTPYERGTLQPPIPVDPQEALRRFYLIWTVKEAYTKALGLGLGFDFKRIQYDVLNDTVRIDNAAPIGWKFIRFDLEVADDRYVGVVAEFMGEKHNTGELCSVEPREAGEWITTYSPEQFLHRAIQNLSS